MYDSFLELFPPNLRAQLVEGNDAVVNQIVSSVSSANSGAKAMIGHGLYVMGVASPSELVNKIKQFTLKDVAHRVSCPTLIMDGAEDHFLPNHGKRLYDRLTCTKDYLLFSPQDGAEEHCQVGALALCHEQLFTWLNTHCLNSSLNRN